MRVDTRYLRQRTVPKYLPCQSCLLYTSSEVIGILTNHNACELLEDAGEWYKVTSGKVTGYVNKQYLVTGDEAEAIAEQEIKTVATVNTETLNVLSLIHISSGQWRQNQQQKH